MTKISQLPPLADESMNFDMLFPTVANGVTQKMTSDQLRKLNQPGFLFPAHPSLTLADRGKIMVNSGGMAKVASANGTIPGQAGQWDIKANVQIQTPKQAAYYINLTANPSPGDSFTFFGKTWTFVPDTPETDFEIEIGTDNAATMANLVSAMNAYGSPIFYTHTYSSGASSIINIGSYYPGNSGNSAGFSTSNAVLYCSPSSTGVDGDYYNLGQPVVEWTKNGSTHTLTILNICDPGAPAGMMVLGFKWPGNASEQLQNMLYALNNYTDFSDNFTVVDMGGSLLVTEALPPVTAVTVFDEASSNYNITQQEDSVIGVTQYVSDVVLGPLMHIEDGQALISSDQVFRAILSPDSAPVEIASIPSNPISRILSYGDNGTVTGPVNLEMDLPVEFFGNGVVLALEEGTPGSLILVKSIFLAGG